MSASPTYPTDISEPSTMSVADSWCHVSNPTFEEAGTSGAARGFQFMIQDEPIGFA